jgi:hypothetical protein
MILYRPVGMEDLRLIYRFGLRTFSPRLPEQPIFYPVLNLGYAEQIAHDWNTKSRSFAGYVTRSEVEDSYVDRFERHVVGGCEHEELWVPAEQLDEFNSNISGRIAVVGAYFGPRFRGLVPDLCLLEGRDAIAQLVLLAALFRNDDERFRSAVFSGHEPVFLHYPFWKQRSFSDSGVSDHERDCTVVTVGDAWSKAFPSIPLQYLDNGYPTKTER